MNFIIGKRGVISFLAEASMEFKIVVESAYPIRIVRETEQFARQCL
jgi:hypothetical protein